ncbi:MAG: RNA 3'-phosphate cyclase [Geobacter sp.]|nr:RNA 3'-phosphate cyclase [Geobacter sp.]
MVDIDGSYGEGGGQVLRTALSLSCITGRPFRIHNIRKGRQKPGLMPQHLVSVHAAQRIAAAEVAGDFKGSQELSFAPGRVTAGDFNFDIGTAGSVSLVLQTIIPPLLLAGKRSTVTLRGGTHVPFSPCFNYLSEVFAPMLARLCGNIRLSIGSHGFYPKGGGEVRCVIEPTTGFRGLQLTERDPISAISGSSAVARLPLDIAERQRQAALEVLHRELAERVPVAIDLLEAQSHGPGTFIFLRADYGELRTGFTALGARGKPAETVGHEASAELVTHHATGAPVDPHLADQLVLYLAMADSKSEFATSRISLHLLTNLWVAARFLPFGHEVDGELDNPGVVRISPR